MSITKMELNSQEERVKSLVAEAMRRPPSERVPCIGLQFVTRSGEPLVEAYGSSVLDCDPEAKAIERNSVFWTASATKLVTAIAFLQLLEKFVIDLDSAEFVHTVLPELKTLKVLTGFTADGSPILEDQATPITSRMLITHQAGMTYSFLNENLWRYIGYDYSKDENHDGTIKGYMHPLISHPGSGFVYSIGHDWIGILIERHTGMKLGEYCHKHIFAPLGLENISFNPSAEMLSRLVSMHARLSNGDIRTRKHLMRAAHGLDTGADHQHSGGGGVFSTLPDFCQILATVLNNGLCARTQNRILQKESIDLLLTNQIENFNSLYGNREMPAANYEMVRPLPEPTTPQLLPNRGFGFGVSLEGEMLERAYGVGLANTFWSLDREKGVAGILSSSIIPLNDPVVLDTWRQAQNVMYS